MTLEAMTDEQLEKAYQRASKRHKERMSKRHKDLIDEMARRHDFIVLEIIRTQKKTA
jgi:hypothetical protein